MARTHVIELGDHIARLAYEGGHSTVEAVWGDAKNAELRERRVDPGVLAPGDSVFIPDAPIAVFKGLELDRDHVLVLELAPTNLRIQVAYTNETPVVDTKCRIGFDGVVHLFDLDEEGRTQLEIGPHTKTLDLEIRGQAFECTVATLHPIETLEGVHGRLTNLGYEPGKRAPAKKSLHDYAFRSAVEEFQCEHDLSVDGVVGPVTRRKLLEVHGS